jgi:hypothetical protein
MPTLVYRYGLLPPTAAAEIVDEQMRLAHRYYNTLTEIERWRRACYRELRSWLPEIENLEAWKSAEVERLELARKAIKAQRSKTRSRSDTADQRKVAQEARDQLREVSALYTAARDASKHDLELEEASRELNAETAKRMKQARAECGCYWGTYLCIENAAEAARKDATFDPEYRRWTGDGVVAVQLQHGLSIDRAIGCKDRRLQIDERPLPCGSGKGKSRPRVRVRVGSQRKDPIWAEWPLVMHRPLPPESKIQWAKVKRERLGGKDRWSLHLTLVVPATRREVIDPHRLEAVAVDVGWRKREDGGLRVAYLVGTDGERLEVLLDPSVLSGIQQVEDLRSIRDQRLNALCHLLVPWLRDHQEELPEWLVDETKTISNWRSQARFSRLAGMWRERREGQSEALEGVYDLLEAWRKKDKHLWLWECNLRDKVLARRREQYRVLAARLAEKYQVVVLEKFNKSETQRKKPAESETPDRQATHTQQTQAATSTLCQCLLNAFSRRGLITAEMPAQWTTRTCHRCGMIDEQWNPAKEIDHRCPACGELADQDAQAADNLMTLWGTYLKHQRQGDAVAVGKNMKIVDHSYQMAGESKWAKRGRHTKSAA